MKKITIPQRLGYPTVDIIVGLKTYTLYTGVEIEVEDHVVEVVEHILALEPKEDANAENKKAATIEYVQSKSFFRGWFNTNLDIIHSYGTINDYAYSVQSGTVWNYDGLSGWFDTGKVVPLLSGSTSGIGLPKVAEKDNGKVMTVVDGEWAFGRPFYVNGLATTIDAKGNKYLHLTFDGENIGGGIILPQGGGGEGSLPNVTEKDNGKVMTVVDGEWEARELPMFSGEFVVSPNTQSDIVLETAQKFLDSNIKINKIPFAEVSNNTGGTTVTIGDEV